MIKKGLTTQSNRVRSYLSGAFTHGLEADLDPLVQATHGKRFYLKTNPAAPVPRQSQFERARIRVLSYEEIQHLWENITSVSSHKAYTLMFRFMLATGGNRPEQLSQIRWSDIDMNRRVFTFVDLKGNKPRTQVMPLTKRAMDVLEELEPITGMYEHPFSTNGKTTIDAESLSDILAKLNTRTADSYVPKDIRRTATNLLIEAGVRQEHRYLVQSRSDGSIETRHYANSNRLTDKRKALKAYDDLLGRIISGIEKPVIDLEEYRQQSTSK